MRKLLIIFTASLFLSGCNLTLKHESVKTEPTAFENKQNCYTYKKTFSSELKKRENEINDNQFGIWTSYQLEDFFYSEKEQSCIAYIIKKAGDARRGTDPLTITVELRDGLTNKVLKQEQNVTDLKNNNVYSQYLNLKK